MTFFYEVKCIKKGGFDIVFTMEINYNRKHGFRILRRDIQEYSRRTDRAESAGFSVIV